MLAVNGNSSLISLPQNERTGGPLCNGTFNIYGGIRSLYSVTSVRDPDVPLTNLSLTRNCRHKRGSAREEELPRAVHEQCECRPVALSIHPVVHSPG